MSLKKLLRVVGQTILIQITVTAMGKGQRERKEQAALAAAALLQKQAKPSPLSPLSVSAPAFVPGGAASKALNSPSPAPLRAKEPSKIDYGVMSKFFARSRESRIRIINAFVDNTDDLAAALADLNLTSQEPQAPDQFAFSPAELAHITRRYGVISPEGSLIVSRIIDSIRSSRLGGLPIELAIRTLASLQSTIEHDIEPVSVHLLLDILLLQGHKLQLFRDLSSQIVTHLKQSLSPLCLHLACPQLMRAISHENDWRCRVAALEILDALALKARESISPLLPHIMPEVTTAFALVSFFLILGYIDR